MHLLSCSTVAAVALVVWLSAGVSARAYAEDSSLKEDAKTVGRETGAAIHKVGEAGKEVGKKVADTAREVGHATRDGAREFKQAVKDQRAATRHHPNANKRSTANGTETKPVDTSIANK